MAIRTPSTRLGLAYFEGRGTGQNFEKGAWWLWRAAEQRHTGAQYRLGLAWRDGCFGGERAFAQAESEKWLRRAADRGHPDAQSALDSIRSGWNTEESE